MKHILLVDDDLTFSTMLGTWLRKKGFTVSTASSGAAAVRTLIQSGGEIHLVLSDLRLPDHDGLYLLQWMKRQGLRQPFIIMTGYAEVQNAVEAMKQGAADYIAKPVQPDLLLLKMMEAMKGDPVPSVEKDSGEIAKKVPGRAPCPMAGDATLELHPGIEGHSPAAKELYRLAALVAPTPMSVLIIGASGTGKEHVAHRIHELSKRAEGPFVAMDCGALTKELAASELFGHVKGAFTGAVDHKTGAFEQASGGTLFLDEVGNLGYDVQVQLLRALQERRIRPVGSMEEKTVDIRLVCATNENLPDAIRIGTFREDLYHRMNEFTLHMPLLRERGADILEFARYFLHQANEELGRHLEDFTPEAQEALMHYAWPGNLREMRNVVVRAALVAEDARFISVTHLNLPLDAAKQARPLSIKPTVDEERQRIAEALQQTGGNKSRAAKLLGIDRKTLYNKLKDWMEE